MSTRKIHFNDFMALVNRADRIEVDGFTVSEVLHRECGRSITLSYTNKQNPECDTHLQIDDDKEFNWDHSSGSVAFLDSDSIEVVIYFYIEFPLQEIPSQF